MRRFFFLRGIPGSPGPSAMKRSAEEAFGGAGRAENMDSSGVYESRGTLQGGAPSR